MYFCIPADFSQKTIEAIKELEKKFPKDKVYEVYGNINGNSVIGSGRGWINNRYQPTTLEELKSYVDYLKWNNIVFNYTINTGCSSNADINGKKLNEIICFLESLLKIGIKRCTIASPVLIDVVKHKLPELEITASVIADINSTRKAKYVQDIGASTIALSEDLTRNIPLIKKINENISAKTEIIVNMMCVTNCPFRKFHYNCLAHSNEESMENEYIEYYVNKCSQIKCNNLEEYIMMQWIRPEDLKIYEDVGVVYFKIIGREIVHNMNIVDMINIYFSRNFDGNLYDLIYGFSEEMNVSIDNKALDGFMNHFLEENNCFKLCGTGECYHCSKYAKKAVKVNRIDNIDKIYMDDFYNYLITSPISIEDLFQGLI